MSDLTELKERIAFSRQEIVVLGPIIENYLRQNIHPISKPNGHAQEHDLFLKRIQGVPTAIKAKAGTIANELRSVLDGLACQLAIRNGKTTAKTYFPISKSREIFESDGMEKIKKLSDADKAKIVAIQPYREASPFLFGLHEIDRTRKHTRLTTCGTFNKSLLGGGIFLVGPNAEASLENLMLNDVPVRCLQVHRDASLDQVGQEYRLLSGVPNRLPVQLIFELGYSEPQEIAGKPVASTLSRFADIVDGIVSQFDHP